MEIEDLVMNFVHEKFGLRGDEDPATPRGGPERALHGLEALLREQTALSQAQPLIMPFGVMTRRTLKFTHRKKCRVHKHVFKSVAFSELLLQSSNLHVSTEPLPCAGSG